MYKLLNALGLVFFIPMVNLKNEKGIISFLVLFNGIACHISRTFSLKYWNIIRNYDILCNFIMGIYIIYYSNYNLIIIFLDLLSVYIFIINYLYYNSFFLIHILGVQLPLSIVTYIY